MCPSWGLRVLVVASIEGSVKLRKDKTLKIRMDVTEVYVLDDVCKSLGFAERATTIRWLIKHYSDILAAKTIKDRYQAAKDAENSFKEVL